MIITCSRSHLEERCLQRGYSFFRASGCVVSSSGDILAVDTDHVDYPAERVGVLSFKCVPDCTTSEFACGSGECCVELPDGSNGCQACSSSSSSVGSSSSSSSSSPSCIMCIDARARYRVGGVLQGGRTVQVQVLNFWDQSVLGQATLTTKTDDSYTDIGCFTIPFPSSVPPGYVPGYAYTMRFQMEGSMACSGANSANPVMGDYGAVCNARVQRGAIWTCP